MTATNTAVNSCFMVEEDIAGSQSTTEGERLILDAFEKHATFGLHKFFLVLLGYFAIRWYLKHREEKRQAAERDKEFGPTKEGQVGSCPNCSIRLPTTSPNCPKCGAEFGPNSGWKVLGD
jgi:hypothetical protein